MPSSMANPQKMICVMAIGRGGNAFHLGALSGMLSCDAIEMVQGSYALWEYTPSAGMCCSRSDSTRQPNVCRVIKSRSLTWWPTRNCVTPCSVSRPGTQHTIGLYENPISHSARRAQHPQEDGWGGEGEGRSTSMGDHQSSRKPRAEKHSW